MKLILLLAISLSLASCAGLSGVLNPDGSGSIGYTPPPAKPAVIPSK